MLDLIRHYPVVVVGAVEAVLALVIAFGLDLSAEQVGAIVAAMSAILALFTTTQTNSKAFVNEELRDAEQAIEAAHRDGTL